MIETVRLTQPEWERLLETASESAKLWDSGKSRSHPETGEPQDKKAFVSAHLSSQIMLFGLVRPTRHVEEELIEAPPEIVRKLDSVVMESRSTR